MRLTTAFHDKLFQRLAQEMPDILETSAFQGPTTVVTLIVWAKLQDLEEIDHWPNRITDDLLCLHDDLDDGSEEFRDCIVHWINEAHEKPQNIKGDTHDS